MFASSSRDRLRGVIALGLVTTLAACDDDGPVAPPLPDNAPTRVFLEWQHPFPQGNDLNRMWGFADGTFYAVGDAGTVLHYDGATWSLVDTPARDDLHGIWAGGPNDIYLAGFDGALVHFNGSAWKAIAAPTHEDLYSVWADGVGGVFITGTGGDVWEHRDGTWDRHTVAPGRRFRALWGYAANDVYVTGSGGAIHHYDGTMWTRIVNQLNPFASREIVDIWGPGPGSLSMVAGGNSFWFEGPAWQFLPLGDDTGYGIWGFSLDEQMVVTAQNSFEWLGGSLRSFPIPVRDEPLYDIWGTTTSNYYAVGRDGRLAHFDGTGWQALDTGGRSNLADIWASGSSALAVGDDGVVLRGNGSAWVEENVGTQYELAGVWDSGTGLSVAVGRYTPDQLDWRQAILMNSGAGWTDAGVIGTAHRLFDVWGSSGSDVYAVGWAGEVLHFDGDSWSVVDDGEGDAAFLASVSGTAADNVIAVGRTDDLRGLVCRFDGSTWTKTVLTGVEELNGVWVASPSLAITVGALGVIRRFDGSAWSSMASPTREALFCVWGSSPSDVYAAGWQGAMIHYDGTSWRKLLPNTHRSIHAISGRSSSEIYLAGDKGAILRFDGF